MQTTTQTDRASSGDDRPPASAGGSVPVSQSAGVASDGHLPPPAELQRQWPASLAVFTICSALLIWLFWGEIAAAVRVWNTSRTYGHAYFVFPICLLLIYRLRHHLVAVRPQPAPWAFVPIVGLTLLWMLGELTNVMVVKQLVFVGLWQSLFLLVLGWQATRVAIFPLAYLYLAVPFGYSIIPALQDVTAQMVVQLLRLTGMPVFLDGYFIQIPSGSFLVAEACSGVRYLIVSVALGILAANLFFHSWRRRLLFVGLSFMVPIIANGVRAYGIIMLAHLSDYRLAVDVDHVVYGFVFLAFVTLTLLGLASFLRDRRAPLTADYPVKNRQGPSSVPPSRLPRLAGQALFGALAIALVFSVQTWIATAKAPPSVTIASLSPPPAVPPWNAADNLTTDWLPQVLGADSTLHHAYQRGEEQVELHINYYSYQREGAEAISDLNNLIGEGAEWQSLSLKKLEIDVAGEALPINEMVLRRGPQTYLVWFWYEIGSEATNSRIAGKLLEMKAIAFGGERGAAVVAIGSKVSEDAGQAAALLNAFLRQHMAGNGSLVLLDTTQANAGSETLKTTSPGDSKGEVPKP